MNNIIAGIVLYNPDISRLIEVIEAIYNQVQSVCVFDNGSKNWTEVKKEIEDAYHNEIICIRNEVNAGIGYATNRIFEEALKLGFDWVLTLDHDTICPHKLITEYKKVSIDNTLGMICPSVIDKEIVSNTWKPNNKTAVELVDRCIQSGALVSVSAWKDVNGFDEWMFIDFVDFDFCTRLKINNYNIYRCNNVVIDHQLGNREETRLAPLFRRIYKLTGIKVLNYFTYNNVFSDIRVFYSTRNNCVYIKKYSNYLDVNKEKRDFYERCFRRIFRGKNKLMIIKETINGIKAAREWGN